MFICEHCELYKPIIILAFLFVNPVLECQCNIFIFTDLFVRLKIYNFEIILLAQSIWSKLDGSVFLAEISEPLNEYGSSKTNSRVQFKQPYDCSFICSASEMVSAIEMQIIQCPHFF